MKATKKLLAFLLAATMLLAILPSAFATEGTQTTCTLTISGTKAGHTYKIYQVFTGDLSTNDQGGYVLSNVKYGSSWSNSELVGTAVSETTLESYKTSGETNITEFCKNKGTEVQTVTSTDSKTVINNLVPGYYYVEEATGSVTGNDAYTKGIICVVGNTEMAVKSSVPTSEKKVKDTNDTTGETTGWQDSADYDIGDDVPFQLTAKLANDVTAYKGAYKVIFHDKLSTGLTFKNITSVKVGETALQESQYTLTRENLSDGCAFHIEISDVKTLEIQDVNEATVTVEYVATLNESAKIGSEGNPNKMHLEFSNNPNIEGGSTGTTPDDTVIVFTYKVEVNKVDKQGKELKGAGFTLYKKLPNNEKVKIKEIKADGKTTKFEFSGLDDGDYILEETETPQGFNTIEPIEFTITAEHEVQSDNPTLTKLDGGDIFKGKVETGTLTANVLNVAGNTLPSTGGMGTTIFYVLGSILAIGAAILLISKKRMNSAQ